MPRDYVMIDPAGAQRLIVRSTAAGAVVATVSAPHGTQVVGVYGGGNGQVFAFATMPVAALPDPAWSWYLLRLRSGGSPEVTRLPLSGADLRRP